jgi:serine protease Do
MRCSPQASVTLLVGFAAGLFLAGTWLQGQNAQPGPNAAPRDPSSYRDVVKKVLPAVVSLEARKPKNKLNPAEPPPAIGETPKDDFGSGFLTASTGVIVTSYHIVRDADQVAVKLHDGRKFVSKDIRTDVRSDLAVILIDSKGAELPFLEFGDSDAMEIGDHVLAVGAPFGLTGSVTHGIVSGKSRDLNLNLYEDFLQTDAAINPGNSGGPLVNLDGKVVGINAAIKSRTGGFQGVGLAVASNLAKDVAAALRKDGVVRRGFLGVQSRNLEPEIAARLGVAKDGGGIVIAQVFAGTPAAKAGLQAGDILTKLDGNVVRSVKGLQMAVARLALGKPVAVEMVRDRKIDTLQASIEEQPANLASPGVPARPLPPGLAGASVAKLGFDVADANADLTRDLGYPAGVRGVLITRVEAGSSAADAGLSAGMLVTRVEGKAVAGAAEARSLLEAAVPSGGFLVQVQSPQGGVTYTLLGGT